jgi:hypothetical protein
MKKHMALAGIALALFFACVQTKEKPKATAATQEHQAVEARRPGERSPAWPALAKRFRAEHPRCEACGTLKGVQVHHVIPFHTDPGRELDETNLISLCKGGCHLKIGHGGSYKHYNPNAREDAAFALGNPERFVDVVKAAKANRRKNQLME